MKRPGAACCGKEIVVRLYGPSRAEVASYLDGIAAGDATVRSTEDGPEVAVLCAGAGVVKGLCDRFGESVFSVDAGPMANVVGCLLAAGGHTVATAESCTGGLVGQMLTSVPGSSDYYSGGFVTYSNDAKVRILGVPQATLDAFGAVSVEVAAAMASSARQLLGVDVAVSVTGIAGPGGGTPVKPVGTVCFGLASAAGMVTLTEFFSGDRREIRAAAATRALDMVRRWCVDNGGIVVLDVAAPAGMN